MRICLRIDLTAIQLIHYGVHVCCHVSGQEPHIIGRYVREMEKVEHIIRKKIIWRGLVSSSGQAIPFFGYAVTLWYGGLLVADQEIHFKNIIK